MSVLTPDERELRRRRRKQVRLARRLRLRRHGRRAYIRSVYFLPSLATLCNAICGFGAIYVAAMVSQNVQQRDSWAAFFAVHGFAAAAYLIFGAMVADALDGRLARFARHTTDFGGQLDSLADAVSFGAAPAFVALQLFKLHGPDLPVALTRLVWSIGAIYMSCALIRLARFNVSNEHGEQHHFSFLGLPSPGAAAAVASVVLVHYDLQQTAGGTGYHFVTLWSGRGATMCVAMLPLLVLASGLLMISNLRYPHLVNRYLRGKRSIGRLVSVVGLLLLLLVSHQMTIAVGAVGYAAWGPVSWLWRRRRSAPAIGTTSP